MKIKLSRKKSNSELLVRNLTTSLILHESITITAVRAKALKSFFENLISHTKSGDLKAKRFASKVLLDNNATLKLFNEIIPRIKNEYGNITIVKLGNRLGDNASMVKAAIILKPLEKKVIVEEEIKQNDKSLKNKKINE